MKILRIVAIIIIVVGAIMSYHKIEFDNLVLFIGAVLGIFLAFKNKSNFNGQ